MEKISAEEAAKIKAALERATKRIGTFENKFGGAYQTKPKTKRKQTVKPTPKTLDVSGKKKPATPLKTKKPYYRGMTNMRQAQQLRELE